MFLLRNYVYVSMIKLLWFSYKYPSRVPYKVDYSYSCAAYNSHGRKPIGISVYYFHFYTNNSFSDPWVLKKTISKYCKIGRSNDPSSYFRRHVLLLSYIHKDEITGVSHEYSRIFTGVPRVTIRKYCKIGRLNDPSSQLRQHFCICMIY